MSTRSGLRGDTPSIAIRYVSILVVLLMVIPGNLPFLPGYLVQAQNDPPPFGEGDWIINTPTLIWNQSINLEGNLIIQSGGTLTLDHTILLLHMLVKYTYNISIMSSGTLIIKNGSYVGSSDSFYSLLVYKDSKLRIQNSTVSGLGAILVGNKDTVIEDSKFISDNVGIVVMEGTNVQVERSYLESSQDAIWVVMGTLTVTDSTFVDNVQAIRQVPLCNDQGTLQWPDWTPSWGHTFKGGGGYCEEQRDVVASYNKILNSASMGIYVTYGTGIYTHNQIEWTTYAGISVDNSQVTISDNEISHHPFGIIVEEWFESVPPQVTTYVNLEDNNITDCSSYSIFTQNTGDINGKWTFLRGASVIDSPILSRIGMTVQDGASLTIKNTTVQFLSMGPTLGINVNTDSSLELDGVTVGYKGAGAAQTVLSAAAYSKVKISNSTLSAIGSGLDIRGDLSMDNTTVVDTPNGLYYGGGNGTVRDCTFINGNVAIDGILGKLEVYDTTIRNANNIDVKVEGGQVDLYNMDFNKSRYAVSSGTINVYWVCQLQSMWGNGALIAKVSYNISDASSTLVAQGMTGLEGISGPFYLREFTDTGSGKQLTTPHSVKGSYIGMTNTTTVSIDGNTLINFYLEDHIAPSLNVTYPGLLVHQTNNSFFANGTAKDKESGLDRVQWSLDQDLWTDVEGLDLWNFSTQLSFGSRDLYIRALDRAGNVANLTMQITVDKTAPFLYILSPQNGFLTKLRTVLVEGRTEYGAAVTIKDQSVVCVDGLFRLSVPIDEGENKLVVVSKDDTGNTNTSSVTVFRDTTPPPITITRPPENYITNKRSEQNLLVTGYTEVGAKLMSQGRFIPVADDGSFSFTFGLQEGTNVLDLVAEDSLGNQNSTLRHVIYDITIPNMTLMSPPDGTYTNKTNITIVGMSEGLANITAKSVNFTSVAKADPAGRFEITIKLSEGQNAIGVTAMDRAGNGRTKTLNIYSDTIAPDMTFAGVTDGMVTDQTSIIVEAQTEANARIKFNGNIVPVGVSGKFGVTLDLFSANNTFTFEATDKAGNTKVVTLHIKRKATPEPKPSGAGAAIDYLPWLILLLVIIVAVQWAFVTRSSMLKAKRKGLGTVSPQGPAQQQDGQYPSPPQRKEPRRPRQGGQVVVQRGNPEFDIEYGSGAEYVPGGGRK